MNGKELDYVRGVLDDEGIEYGLNHYTDFKDEVKDPEFHQRLAAYHKARTELFDYINYDPERTQA